MDSVSPWKIFPFSYPDSFQVILNSMDTHSILNCRRVCTTWRTWFNTSKTVWSGVLPKVVIRAISRRVKEELEQVWEIRLDLLLEMMDECWTEKQEMSMAIRIERASKQKLWREFEHTLTVVNQLHQEFARGPMTSPCVGPVSIFLRCKVANHKVLSVVGETLASHLNCVFIDEKDKGVDAVRQCIFRAMISSQQAPRWVFKDFELGWLEIDEDNARDEDEVPLSWEGADEREEEPVPSLFGWFNLIKNYFNPVYNLLAFLWSWVITKEVKYDSDTEDNQAASQVENEDDLYCQAPPRPSHPFFPSVLELLDCDSPWLKKFLVDKAGIDKILVVPRFEEASSYAKNFDSNYTLAGVDETGAVCHLQCSSLEEYEGAVVGNVEYPASNFHGEGYKVHFWGGRDVRDRWPLFASELGDLAHSSQDDVEEGLDESWESLESKDDFYESSQEDTDTGSSCMDGSDQAQVSDFSEESEELDNENDFNAQSSLSVSVSKDGVYMISRSEGGKLTNDKDVSDEFQTSDLAVSPDLSDCVDDSSEDGQEFNNQQARNGDNPSVIHDGEEGTNVISNFEKEQSDDELKQDVLEDEVEKRDYDLENYNVEEETGNGENESMNYAVDEEPKKSDHERDWVNLVHGC